MTPPPSKPRGGSRPGAGRKPSGRRREEIQLRPEMSRWLRQAAHRALLSKGEIIERLIQLHAIHYETDPVNKKKSA